MKPDGTAGGWCVLDNLVVDAAAPVAEPASALLLGIGLTGLGVRRYRHTHP